MGADGETTWLIAPGVSSGSFDQDGGFVGTGTGTSKMLEFAACDGGLTRLRLAFLYSDLD